MTKKLIIFDCDGVLVDSELIAHQVMLDALKPLGCTLTIEESIREFTGVNQQKSQQILAEKYGLNLPENFWEVLQRLVIEAFEKELVALNQAVLTRLSQKNVSFCVASSSQRQRVLQSLTITNQLSFFDPKSIFTSQQVKHGKPAPDLFLLAASKMGYAPQECVVIEDSVAGIQAALVAKMDVIGFLGGSHAHFSWYQEQLQTYDIPFGL